VFCPRKNTKGAKESVCLYCTAIRSFSRLAYTQRCLKAVISEIVIQLGGSLSNQAGGGLLIRSKSPACFERRQLDLPGFKNLEGLPNDDIPQILVYNDERRAWERV
jgi:hypothetical protein